MLPDAWLCLGGERSRIWPFELAWVLPARAWFDITYDVHCSGVPPSSTTFHVRFGTLYSSMPGAPSDSSSIIYLYLIIVSE
jgi:hypothetical protein